MPCRHTYTRGGPPAPGPSRLVQCRCAPGGTQDRRRDSVFCTTDTCADPRFCVTFKPEYCPNVVAATPQEEDWISYHLGERPPVHETHPPWLPPLHFSRPPLPGHYMHHSSLPGHYMHPPPFHYPHPPHPPYSPHSPHAPGIPYTHDSYRPHPQLSPTPSEDLAGFARRPSFGTSQQPPYTTREASEYAPTTNTRTPRPSRPPSTAVLNDDSNVQPIETNPTKEQFVGRGNVGATSNDPITRVASRKKLLASRRRVQCECHSPRVSSSRKKLHASGRGTQCESESPRVTSSRKKLHTSGRGTQCESEIPRGQQRAGAKAQPISPALASSQQAQSNPAFTNNKAADPAGAGAGADAGAGAGCECRMPAAFAHLRCTGNLDGFCGCVGCEHNK